jgi:hypothetical protein
MMARFARNAEKVFDWNAQVARVRDSRPKPQVPAAAVFLSAMMMFVARLKSLNALEGELRFPGRWERIVGKRKPSADTVGRVVGLTDSECLRDMLSFINHKIRRNKALDENPWPLRIVAFDGHEFFSLKTSPLRSVLPENDHDQEKNGGERTSHRVLPPRRRGPPHRLRDPRHS